MKPLLKALVIVSAILMLTLPVQAAEFKTDDNSVTVSGEQAHKNLHIASGNVTVDSKVEGDLLIAGGTILANGEVTGGLFIAGGTVTVRSHVNNHVRITGGQVTLSGKVDGDVFIGAGTVTIDKQAEILGGIYLAGGDVIVNGNIHGVARIAAGSLSINGPIGSVKAYVDQLTLGENARIDGDLTYYSSNSADIDSAAIIGGKISHEKVIASNTRAWWYGGGILGMILKIIGSILLAWAIVHFYRRRSKELVQKALDKPLTYIGFGFVNLFLTIIAVFLLMVSVIGFGFGMILFNIWILSLLVGSIFGKIILGSWMYKLLSKRDLELSLPTVSLGVVASAVLIYIPFFGSFIDFIFFLLGVGVIFRLITDSYERSAESN